MLSLIRFLDTGAAVGELTAWAVGTAKAATITANAVAAATLRSCLVPAKSLGLTGSARCRGVIVLLSREVSDPQSRILCRKYERDHNK